MVGISPQSRGTSLAELRQRADEIGKSKAFLKDAEEKPEAKHENFITSVVANRQPPRLPLTELIEPDADAPGVLFAQDLKAFYAKGDTQIAGDLATVFLEYFEQADATNNPELGEAFAELGELARNYEHLRILRTGELG
ncbi:MAG: hypothetical protein AAF509_14645 [Pseudomonadota bacterium]